MIRKCWLICRDCFNHTARLHNTSPGSTDTSLPIKMCRVDWQKYWRGFSWSGRLWKRSTTKLWRSFVGSSKTRGRTRTRPFRCVTRSSDCESRRSTGSHPNATLRSPPRGMTARCDQTTATLDTSLGSTLHRVFLPKSDLLAVLVSFDLA
jgi:hypothetical protein